MSRLTEQIRMMEEMLKLQSNIREKKEKERVFKTVRNEKYADIFKPITNTLEKLKPAPPIPVAPVNNEEGGLKQEGENGVDATLTEEPDGGSDTESEEDSIYDEVLQTIPEYLRSDGVFGLKVNPRNHRVGQIGAYNFRVMKNNRIDFYTAYRQPYEAHITDPDLWRLLLVKNPNTIKLGLFAPDGQYKSFVLHYKEIVDGLGLTYNLRGNLHPAVTQRIKYKLVQDLGKMKIGHGFMFSVRPPPFAAGKRRIKPSTVVIPSDKKGLLRELVKAVAELRAGNTSMRDIVVPLAQEARRKRILPRNMLTADEKTWVFS